MSKGGATVPQTVFGGASGEGGGRGGAGKGRRGVGSGALGGGEGEGALFLLPWGEGGREGSGGGERHLFLKLREVWEEDFSVPSPFFTLAWVFTGGGGVGGGW